MNEHISIGGVCRILGISLSTAYRWIKAGTLVPAFMTCGGHRRFRRRSIEEIIEAKPRELRGATYARVSSSDQRQDLETQSLKLQHYAEQHFPGVRFTHVTDLGSGLNYKKKGLNQLLGLILSRKIDLMIINHKDRLLRFGSELIFKLCKFCGVEVVIVEASIDEVPFEQELARDVIELMTVFCARLYGRRSHKNKQATSALQS